jgi:hypothetical protein
MMREPDGARLTSDAALLPLWGVALLVRHVSNHADEVDGKIAATALRRRLAPAADDALVVSKCRRTVWSAGVGDSVICLIRVVGSSGGLPSRASRASSGEDFFASRPVVVATTMVIGAPRARPDDRRAGGLAQSITSAGHRRHQRGSCACDAYAAEPSLIRAPRSRHRIVARGRCRSSLSASAGSQKVPISRPFYKADDGSRTRDLRLGKPNQRPK